MKVELDLSTEQLQELDKGLLDLLKTLNDDQKVQLIRAYLENKMDENLYIKHDSFYSSKELSSFGKEIFDGLQERIKDSITDELFNNEDLQSDLNDIVNRLKKNLYEIVESSVSSYIINNLFRHQDDLQQQIQQTIWSMRSRGELK